MKERTGTFAKLPDGTWGARIPGEAEAGDEVELTTKAGRVHRKVVTEVVQQVHGRDGQPETLVRAEWLNESSGGSGGQSTGDATGDANYDSYDSTGDNRAAGENDAGTGTGAGANTSADGASGRSNLKQLERKGTFTKLPDGEWGARIAGKAEVGDIAVLTTKAGKKHRKVITEVVQEREGYNGKMETLVRAEWENKAG